jgi:hypothetical protein
MRIFGRWGLVVAAVLLAVPSSASALPPPSFTWSGATTDPHWSNTGNWAGGTAPSGSVGTLTFPTLTSAGCTAQPPTDACYVSNNDISGLSAGALSFTGSQPYLIQGNGITLGAGGITVSPPSGGPQDQLDTPITLGAAQTWTVGNGSAGGGVDVQNVSGAADTLTANVAHGAVVGFLGDAEVGTFNALGADSTQTGMNAFHNGFVGLTGSLNGTDGNAVNVTDVAAVASSNASVGPLTSTGGQIELTVSATGPSSFTGAILTVDGGVTLDAASATDIAIVNPGTTAGADYSQLSASGPANLAGALFVIGGPSCTQFHMGDVDTLITTTGLVSGTFAGVPDGTVVPVGCNGASPSVRINYTAHTVTATVVNGGTPSSSTSLAASPSSPVTNQPVTLTATITAASGSPSGGTVAFGTSQGPFAGCGSQPVTWNGTTGTATCQISFAASSSPGQVFAKFTPTNPSVQGSLGGPVPLSVGEDSTTTALSASNASPNVGQSVTYTATVTPAHAGSAQPSGTVQFEDGGMPIADCGAQPVSAGAATCTASYGAGGSHSITAMYSGDGNFTGSTSAGQAVNVPAPSSSTETTAGTATTAGSGSQTTQRPPGRSVPTVAQIRAALSRVLVPRGAAARIAAVLAHEGYRFTFSSPAPGRLTIIWYFLPGGAHLSSAHKPKPIVIASAHLSLSQTGPVHVTVRLTSAGRRMLENAHTLHLVSKASYQPGGGKATSTTRRFTLKR